MRSYYRSLPLIRPSGLIISCVLVIGLAVPSAVCAAPPKIEGIDWKPITELSDDFDGTSLDQSKWRPFLPYWEGRGGSKFEPANVKIVEGRLELRSSVRADPTAPIGAACMSSRMPIAGYGYYEARLKASKLSMTSSFWLQKEQKSEIDLVEAFGAAKRHPKRAYEMRPATHSFSNGWTVDRGTSEIVHLDQPVTEWHTYGVWWKNAREVIFYLDEMVVSKQTAVSELETPMYLFFDTEPFTAEGLPTEEELANPEINTMYVDWVRAYAASPALGR